jgi:hypothetical protein
LVAASADLLEQLLWLFGMAIPKTKESFASVDLKAATPCWMMLEPRS